MSWEQRGEDRWEWLADEDIHVLVKRGDELLELHGTTLHEYAVGSAGFFPLDPLAGTEHRRTTYHAVPDGPFATVDDALAWLESRAA